MHCTYLLQTFLTAIKEFDYLLDLSDLIFPSGSMKDSSRCVSINITDDAALEGNQTFTVTLTTSDPDVLLGNDMTVITIEDNDGSQNCHNEPGVHFISQM